MGDLGDNVLSGLAGADAIDGLAGSDVLEGGAQRDELHGGFGADRLNGEEGDDVLDGGLGYDGVGGPSDSGDVLSGGDGTDWVTYRSHVFSVWVTVDSSLRRRMTCFRSVTAGAFARSATTRQLAGNAAGREPRREPPARGACTFEVWRRDR